MGPCCPSGLRCSSSVAATPRSVSSPLHAGGYLFVFLPTLLGPAAGSGGLSLPSFSNADLVAELKAVPSTSAHVPPRRSDRYRQPGPSRRLPGARLASLPPCQGRLWCWWMWTTSAVFNDHYGHQVGTSACNRWRACWPEVLRREDDPLPVAAERSSPLLLPCTTLQGAMQIAEQVRTSLRASAFPTTNPGPGRVIAASGWRPWCRISITPLPSLSRKRMRLSGQA